MRNSLSLLMAVIIILISSLPAAANYFDIINLASQGMNVQRDRMDIIAENIANVDTIRTKSGDPYRRQYTIIAEGQGNNNNPAVKGVKTQEIKSDETPFKMIYEPNNPYANAEGFVSLPNVNNVKEMIDMMNATRAYEANVQVLNTAKQMVQKALTIGR